MDEVVQLWAEAFTLKQIMARSIFRFHFILLLILLLEDCGFLHIEDELYIYSVQCAFLPLIQKSDSFRLGWAHHSMRTQNNCTLCNYGCQGYLKQIDIFRNMQQGQELML